MSVQVIYTPRLGGVDRLLHDPTGPYGQWLARIGNQATSAAKSRANVDTGLMRSTIEFRVEVRGGVIVGILSARTHYARYVHDGTRYRAGNPFLVDGVRDTLR